jgi:hypothetical protein
MNHHRPENRTYGRSALTINREKPMALTNGEVVHFTPGRVRVRFPEKRNDPDFFRALEKPLKAHPEITAIRSNPLTGSLLLEGSFTDAGRLAEYAKSHELFFIETAETGGVPLRKKIYQSFDAGNRFVKDRSSNQLDLPVLIFLLLLGSGIYQLARSEVRLPPWYTAFWYALGVFTKSLSDLDTADDGGE